MTLAVRAARHLLPRAEADRFLEEWASDSFHAGRPILGTSAMLWVALRLGIGFRLRLRVTKGTSMNDRSLTPQILGIGLGASGLMLLLAVLVSPLGIVGLVGVGVTFLVVAVHRAQRRGNGWWAAWAIAFSAVVWIASSIVTWTYWGVSFDLSDAGKPVPTGVTAITFGSFALGLIAFAALIAIGIFSTVSSWRQTPYFRAAPES